ncbi:uncharacterized protein BJ171DRAFT_509262 [Polychytrium aggregatum]|uniref:uncharacterized protein n=1 Tax=Polychytrium aggregatum TaxID=110093 RepID=UPI0022FE0E5A|nr:uncharacterized protein BJ171DRAFT_509262 [Polychytrium aggregatum]KAI9203678.1 hypothetical protein BJ171DRAFT_509262 [Polychytrium aggregatum]
MHPAPALGPALGPARSPALDTAAVSAPISRAARRQPSPALQAAMATDLLKALCLASLKQEQAVKIDAKATQLSLDLAHKDFSRHPNPKARSILVSELDSQELKHQDAQNVYKQALDEAKAQLVACLDSRTKTRYEPIALEISDGLDTTLTGFHAAKTRLLEYHDKTEGLKRRNTDIQDQVDERFKRMKQLSEELDSDRQRFKLSIEKNIQTLRQKLSQCDQADKTHDRLKSRLHGLRQRMDSQLKCGSIANMCDSIDQLAARSTTMESQSKQWVASATATLDDILHSSTALKSKITEHAATKNDILQMVQNRLSGSGGVQLLENELSQVIRGYAAPIIKGCFDQVPALRTNPEHEPSSPTVDTQHVAGNDPEPADSYQPAEPSTEIVDLDTREDGAHPERPPQRAKRHRDPNVSFDSDEFFMRT